MLAARLGAFWTAVIAHLLIFPALAAPLFFLLDGRPIAVVWADHHARGPFGPFEAALAAAFALVGGGFLLMGFLRAPALWAGQLGPSYEAALRVCAAFLGWAQLLFILGGAALEFSVGRNFVGGMCVMIVIPGSIQLLVWRVQFAATRVADERPPISAPPRCEGCGYELTMAGEDARCPECAMLVADSCDPSRSRRTGLTNWLEDSRDALLTPGRFYARLQLRTPLRPALSFSARHYLCLAAGAVLWGMVLISTLTAIYGGSMVEAFALGLVLGGSAFPAICLAGHSLGAAAVLGLWMSRRAMPDLRWAAQIAHYETVFLWAYAVCWGLIALSFVVFGDWLTRVSPPYFFDRTVQMKAEPFLVLCVTVGLSLLWLRRYVIAYRGIRWSNF